MRTGRTIVVVASALALLVAACGGSGSHTSSPTAGGTDAPPPSVTTTTTPTSAATGYRTGATMELAFASSPTNFNPLAAPGPSSALQTVAAAVLPSAFRVNGDASTTMSATLLTSATQTSANPQTVVYQLNPRAVWSDGTPITGADFVTTWQAQSGLARYRDTGGAAYTPASTLGYDRIASVVTDPQDPDTVTVTFRTRDPDWRALFSPILPAHIVTAVGFDHGFTDPVTSLVSGGPFVVTSYQAGVELTLARNPRWWGPEANLASIDVSLGVPESVAAASLLDGTLDAAVLSDDPTTVTTLATTDGLAAPVTASDTYDDLVFDERRPDLAGRALRIAIAATVDRAALQTTAAATDPAAALVSDRVRQPGEGNDAAAAPAAAGVAADLRAGGFERVGSTLVHDGRPVALTLAVAVDGPLVTDEVSAIEAACHKLGIALTISPLAPAAAARRVAAGRYDLGLVASQVASFPIAVVSRYESTGADNVTGYSSSTMDRLLDRVDTLPDGPARSAAVTAVDRLAWAAAIDVPLLAEPVVLATQSRYSGVTALPGPAGPTAGIASWGIPQHT